MKYAEAWRKLKAVLSEIVATTKMGNGSIAVMILSLMDKMEKDIDREPKR